MPGLVPGIHAQKPSPTSKVVCSGAAWMAGTSPAMTSKDREQPNYISDSVSFRFPRTALREAGEGGRRSRPDEGQRKPLRYSTARKVQRLFTLFAFAFLGVSVGALTIAMRRPIHRERSVTIRDRRNADNMHFVIAQYH
jgi:hypothetical protein